MISRGKLIVRFCRDEVWEELMQKLYHASRVLHVAHVLGRPIVAKIKARKGTAETSRHCGDDTGLVNGAGVNPINDVPRNFPSELKFQVNSALPALLQRGQPLRSG